MAASWKAWRRNMSGVNIKNGDNGGAWKSSQKMAKRNNDNIALIAPWREEISVSKAKGMAKSNEMAANGISVSNMKSMKEIKENIET